VLIPLRRRLATMIVLAVTSLSSPAEVLLIAAPASHANPEQARTRVKEECNPETTLPVVMREEILKRTGIQHVMLTDNPTEVSGDLVMTISILAFNVRPGAGYSTEPRSLRIRSRLDRNGELLGQTELQSSARG